MTLKILVQNALDAFSDAATADEFIAQVERVRPDVAVFPEAYDADRLQTVAGGMQRLTALGYDVVHGSYDDMDGRKDLHGMALIIRRELAVASKPGRLTRVGLRNVVECWVADPASHKMMHIVGVHLNDRSEAKRQTELDDLLRMLVTNEPTVIAGDLNALHARDGRGPALWPAHVLALLVKLHLFPARDPVQTLHQKKTLARLGSRARRLSEIASGKTLRRFLAAGFTDADLRHRATYPAGQPFVQLDHIMLTKDIIVRDFRVLPKNSSDHRGILAEVEIQTR